MNSFIRVVAVVVAFVALSGEANAGQAVKKSGPGSTVGRAGTPPADTAEPQGSTNENKISVLEAQNALLRDYQQHLLATVYWSLGILAVIAVLLVGFGWYVNLRVYDRDKAALRQEMQGAVTAELSKASNALNETALQIQKSLNERLAQLEKQMSEAGRRAAEVARDDLNRTKDSLSKDITRLELKVIEQRADNWRARKVPTNEIRAAIELIYTAQKIGYDWVVSRALDRIRECFKTDVKPDADLAKDLVQTLDSLPSQYSTEVAGLKEALRMSRG